MLYVDYASFDKDFLLVSVNGYITEIVVLCVVEKTGKEKIRWLK